ncbi:MAG: M81 family metallopeptidase [Pirellulaceae bacterium]
MRIASAGIQHETNTFSDVPTRLADFERDSDCGSQFVGGDRIADLYQDTNTIHGGYLAGAISVEADIEPLLCARAQPSGRVDRDAFEHLMGLLIDRLRGALPVDGVLLDLHGAMATDDHDDAEGEIIARVRELVGKTMPVVVTFDLHANITQRMVELSDVLIGFNTYPHVDMYDRGVEAAQLLCRMIRGELKPVQAFRQLPLITLPPMQCTLREPMKSLMSHVADLKVGSDIVAASVAMGFPFADIEDAGVSVLVTSSGDSNRASTAAEKLARRVWSFRDLLQPELTAIAVAMQHAQQLAADAGPVIFADGSDNPGGGAPCDGTVALRALVDADFRGAVVGILSDPETVAQAHAAGVGRTIEALIGGKTDDRHGESVRATARICTLSDGEFLHRGPMRQGIPGHFGRMATLRIGGVTVVVAENRMQLLDREMLRIAGVTPERSRLIVVKSAVHFRADFQQMASVIFDADTPGIHRPDFANFDYRSLRRPIYPLDSDVEFESES